MQRIQVYTADHESSLLVTADYATSEARTKAVNSLVLIKGSPVIIWPSSRRLPCGHLDHDAPEPPTEAQPQPRAPKAPSQADPVLTEPSSGTDAGSVMEGSER